MLNRRTLLFSLPSLTAACAALPAAPAELAPEGTLRAAYFNAPLFVKHDTQGQPHGLAIDLLEELARRAARPLEATGFDVTPLLLEALKAGQRDLSLMTDLPARRAFCDFTPPFMETEETFAVHPSLSIRHVDEIDLPGVKVAVVRGTSTEAALAARLKRAELMAVGSRAEYLAANSHGALAYANDRNNLLLQVAKMPGWKVLDGAFNTAPTSVAIPKGRPQALAWLSATLDALKREGFFEPVFARMPIQARVVRPA